MLNDCSKLEYTPDEKRSVEALITLVQAASLTGEEMPGQRAMAGLLAETGAELEWLSVDTAKLFDAYPDIAQYPTHWQHDLILPYDGLPSYQALVNSGLDDVLTYEGRPNLVAKWKGTGGGKSLILNGHIDTVTVEPRGKWAFDPFGAEVVDGKLYGRGSVDMKGGLVAAVSAMRILRERGVVLKGDVILQSVVNEEHSGNGTLDLVRRGVTADAAIVLEPTQARIVTNNPGGLYWVITIPGVVRSPGARWVGGERVGISAIEVLGPVLSELQRIEEHYCTIGGPGAFSLVIGQVVGGHYDTATAGHVVLRGTAYFSEKLGDVTQVMERFRALTADVGKQCPFLAKNPITVQFLHHDDGSSQPEVPGIARTLAEVLAGSGRNPEVAEGKFVCDMRHLVNRGGIPSIIFGPGDISQAHKVDEHIAVRDYLDFIDLLVELIPKWCNSDRDSKT